VLGLVLGALRPLSIFTKGRSALSMSPSNS
jgi:hypothetical protein